jgi:hypothetical protein
LNARSIEQIVDGHRRGQVPIIRLNVGQRPLRSLGDSRKVGAEVPKHSKGQFRVHVAVQVDRDAGRRPAERKAHRENWHPAGANLQQVVARGTNAEFLHVVDQHQPVICDSVVDRFLEITQAAERLLEPIVEICARRHAAQRPLNQRFDPPIHKWSSTWTPVAID